MTQLSDEQVERLATLAWETYRQATSYEELVRSWEEGVPDTTKSRMRAIARAVGELLLGEEVPKWKAECEVRHREDSIAIADLQWGIEQLQQHLRKGGTVKVQDREWWLFSDDGEGITNGINVLELVLKLSKREGDVKNAGTQQS